MLRATVYSTVSLAFCAWIVQSSRYLWILNNSGASFSKFLQFTSYLSVDIVAAILPISLAVSATFVYQRFNDSNQSIALQSMGISPRKMLVPLIHLSFLITGYLYTSNFFISPESWRKFRLLEWQMKNNIDPPQKSGTIFSNSKFSVYAKGYGGNFVLKDIYIVDSRDPEKISSYFAESGTIKDNVLVLENGEHIEIIFKDFRKSIMHFDSYNYDLKEILDVEGRITQPTEMYLHELLMDNPDKVKEVAQKALFHQKITSPLLVGIFSLLAFLLVMLAPYSRKTSYFRRSFLIISIIVIQGSYSWIANAAANQSFFIYLNYLLLISLVLVLLSLIYKKRKL
jgi:lipopolysaccharide export system permease protein